MRFRSHRRSGAPKDSGRRSKNRSARDQRSDGRRLTADCLKSDDDLSESAWVAVRVNPGGDPARVTAVLFAAGSQGIQEDGDALVTHFPPGTRPKSSCATSWTLTRAPE